MAYVRLAKSYYRKHGKSTREYEIIPMLRRADVEARPRSCRAEIPVMGTQELGPQSGSSQENEMNSDALEPG